ncbi:uncharacterized protein LOC122669952 [Telopea speciosissima]|uniref:uncharacterized protein LOC122669952 n=1 Tax=Telopea speciosissima TaxID=54955 RepID=UPI001CC626FB|nr:uncharacterized protein LOC122669952 [Telopea speciosissima]
MAEPSSSFCSAKFLVVICLITAIPLALVISLERRIKSEEGYGGSYEYYSNGWLRESCKWDDLNRRFLISSFDGGLSQILLPHDHNSGTVLLEEAVVHDDEVAGNATLGIVIDRSRNRLLVAIADVLGNRYGAVAAYDLTTWNRLFLTQLSGLPGDEKSFADDVAVDSDGNAYITDAKNNKIWKVGVEGDLKYVIKSPLFHPKEWYKTFVGLNGIVYHPKGFLLVIHTFTGNLFKIDHLGDVKEEVQVKLVKLVGGGSLALGDGMELMSPTKLVVAGSTPSGRLVESLDEWETAKVVAKYSGPLHRLATGVTVKDGKPYLNHMFGLGLPRRKHVIVEAAFSPV